VKFGFSVPVGAEGEDRLKGVQDRFEVITEVNKIIADSMLYVDLSQLSRPDSLAGLVSRCRSFIFPQARMPLLRSGLDATAGGGSEFQLSLNFMGAHEFAASGDVDTVGKFMVFSQAFRRLHFMPPKLLRRTGQLWKVADTSPVNLTYGLDSTDVGGPYRSSYSTMCRELQSPSLSLLIKSPNARMNVGSNRDAFLPNPAATSQIETQMFEFLGKLFGIAVRNKEHLNLTLSSIVWKRLVGEPLVEEDLLAVDSNTVDLVNLFRSAKEGDSLFEKDKQTFTLPSATGRVVELFPGGASVPVSFANRAQFADACVQFRLREYDAQIDAILRGMSCMIPTRVLSVFTGAELEELVCGASFIDAENLRKNTIYESCSDTDAFVQHFWVAFGQLTQEDRRRFVSFAYGRSRLPRDLTELPHRFKITPLGGDRNERALPHSHTCFFHIELPRYTSPEQCKEKLLVAIYG